MQGCRRHETRIGWLIGIFCLVAFSSAVHADESAWSSIHRDLFSNRAISQDDDVLLLEAPEKADDAAVVPIRVRIPPEYQGVLRTLTLIIDNNPSPVAATFHFGPAAGFSGERMIATRVRMNAQSAVRAILETEDGTLHMATRLVNAAGGCSAASPKDQDGVTEMGDMRIKILPPAAGSTWLTEGQVMLRHPNYTGMQMDPATGTFLPARFVNELTVTSGGEMVFKMEGGIAISANPHLRFTLQYATGQVITATAVDTDGASFVGVYPAEGF